MWKIISICKELLLLGLTQSIPFCNKRQIYILYSDAHSMNIEWKISDYDVNTKFLNPFNKSAETFRFLSSCTAWIYKKWHAHWIVSIVKCVQKKKNKLCSLSTVQLTL